MMVAMRNIYEEATQGFEVDEATARRIHGLIWDAWSLQITLSASGIFVETVPPHGDCKVLGRFSSMLDAQNFAWAWLTGPHGVVRDVRFAKVVPGICEIDLNTLIRDIRAYLEERA